MDATEPVYIHGFTLVIACGLYARPPGWLN